MPNDKRKVIPERTPDQPSTSQLKQSKQKKQQRGGGVENCQGYYDEYGIWNNGFTCPRWGGSDEQYCCGGINNRYCCPQPIEPVKPAPTNSYIPVIVGLIAGIAVVIIITVVSCFRCRCCPGYKMCKRSRDSRKRGGEHTCSCGRSRTTVSSASSHPEYLHCGCAIDRTSPREPQAAVSCGADTSGLMTLYENPAAGWQTDVDQGRGEAPPFDDPPPYSERDLMKMERELPPDMTSSITKPTPHRKNSDPNALCMTTFRPLTSPGPLCSPGTSCEGSMRVEPSQLNHLAENKRDSGVLVEEQLDNDCTTTGIISMSSLNRTLERISRTCGATGTGCSGSHSAAPSSCHSPVSACGSLHTTRPRLTSMDNLELQTPSLGRLKSPTLLSRS